MPNESKKTKKTKNKKQKISVPDQTMQTNTGTTPQKTVFGVTIIIIITIITAAWKHAASLTRRRESQNPPPVDKHEIFRSSIVQI